MRSFSLGWNHYLVPSLSGKMHANECFCDHCVPATTLAFPLDICACRGYAFVRSTQFISGYCQGVYSFENNVLDPPVDPSDRCRWYYKQHVVICRSHGDDCNCYTCLLIHERDIYANQSLIDLL